MNPIIMKVMEKKSPLRINDIVERDFYGVLFFDRRWMEEAQRICDMEGAYTTEWQWHYWAYVGRSIIDNEIVDIAFPVAFYNYPQDVSSGSVEFDLCEVTEAAEAVEEQAKQKAEEISQTELFAILESLFNIKEWKLVKHHSLHFHPNGVTRFSGTDYRQDASHPGVVYPLSEGTLIPNFASIGMHIEEYAEMIHTEYRVFNRDGNNLDYYHGRCMVLDKGFDVPEPEPAPEPKETWVNQLFGTRRLPPPTPKPEKKRPHKILTDQMEDAQNVTELGEQLMELWEKCDFTVDFSGLNPENIITERRYSYGNGDSLFPEYGNPYYPKKTVNTTTVENNVNGTMIALRRSLLDLGYEFDDISNMNVQELKEELDFANNIANSEREDIEFMKEALIQSGIYSKEKTEMLTNEQIQEFYDELIVGEK